MRVTSGPYLWGYGLILNHENYHLGAREYFVSNRVFNMWNSLHRNVVGTPPLTSLVCYPVAGFIFDDSFGLALHRKSIGLVIILYYTAY